MPFRRLLSHRRGAVNQDGKQLRGIFSNYLYITRMARSLSACHWQPRENSMDEAKLPRHIIEQNERCWADKLRQEAGAWQGLRQQPRQAPSGLTESGVLVVRRNRRPRAALRADRP
jgi:hypothetical protein